MTSVTGGHTEPATSPSEKHEEKKPSAPEQGATEKRKTISRINEISEQSSQQMTESNNNSTKFNTHDNPDTDTGDCADAQKRRRRRTQAELTRSFECPFRDCERKYASSHALTLHVRLKHPTEQHLYHNHLGQMRPSRPGFSSLFSSTGSAQGKDSVNLGKESEIRGVKHANVDSFVENLIAPRKRMSLSSEAAGGSLPQPVPSSFHPSRSFAPEKPNGQHELVSRIIAQGGHTGLMRSVSCDRSYGHWDNLPGQHALPMRGGGRHSYPMHHASGGEMHPRFLHHSALTTPPYNDYPMGYSSRYFPPGRGKGYNYEPDYYPNAYSMPMASPCPGCALCPADPIDYYPYGFAHVETYTPQHPFSKPHLMSGIFSDARGAKWSEPSSVLEEEGLGVYRKGSVCSEEEALLARARGIARQTAVTYKPEVGKTLEPGHSIRERGSLDSAVF